MTLSFTAIVPSDGAKLALKGAMTFTLSTDLRDAEGVMVSVYLVSADTEEMAWDGSGFVGRYAVRSTKSGDDFILNRRGGWPTGGVSLRVRELGKLGFMSVFTDGAGAPSNGVGENGDYYIDTTSHSIYKKAAGTYSILVAPTVLHESSGPTDLTVGAVADGQYLKRVGSTLVGAAAGLTVKEEGGTLSTAVTSIDFVGGEVTATGTTEVTVTIPVPTSLHETSGPTDLSIGSVADGLYLKRSGSTIIGAAAGLTVKDEGSTLSTAVTSVDFVGLSVTATGTTAVTVTLAPLSGNTASRPVTPATGTMYLDTTLAQPIWYNGTNWSNAAGVTGV
jgi:hypothetical protein